MPGWPQVLAAAVGAALTSGRLALYLGNPDEVFMPVVVAGSIAAFMGRGLFLVIVVIDLREGKRPQALAS